MKFMDSIPTEGACQAEPAQEKERRQPPAIPPIAECLRLITEEQAACLLGLHVQTLRRWRREGTGPPALALGRRRFAYRVGDLATWQDGRRT